MTNLFVYLNANNDKFDINSINENSSDVYILDVDLEYPDELLEKLEITEITELQKNVRLVMICCQIIVVISQINRA